MLRGVCEFSPACSQRVALRTRHLRSLTPRASASHGARDAASSVTLVDLSQRVPEGPRGWVGFCRLSGYRLRGKCGDLSLHWAFICTWLSVRCQQLVDALDLGLLLDWRCNALQ